MKQEHLVITYPPLNPGTDKTDIIFYDSRYTLKPSVSGSLTVTDTNLAAVCGIRENAETLILPPGETAKTPQSVLIILQRALAAGLARDSVFTGIGGGVICDMTAFAASIYMRGAQLELIPTTLLAMVDAAIGGKTACDFGGVKNIMGTFYPASKIHMYPGFLKTLSETEYLSGMAEVIKTAMLYDAELFQILKKDKKAVMSREPETLYRIITGCASAKARIAAGDLTEKGRRMELNFGHTFGHALESAAGFGSITHGEAVAWGIGRALDLGVRLGITENAYRDETAALLESYGWTARARHSALKTSPENLLEYMKSDKKKRGGKLRFVLQSGLEKTVIREVEDTDILAVLV